MPDYSQGKIYKLVNSIDDLIYVGSTCRTLSTRESVHKYDSKILPDRKVYTHLNQVGWDNVTIELIEAYECKDKDELHTRERYWVETLKPELNTKRPIRSSEEKVEYDKEYYQQNKEEKNARWKEHYQQNREEEIARKKEYYQQNKEEIDAKNKEYRDLNREKLNKQHMCECGGRYTHKNISIHIKTKKHLNYINQK